MHLQKEKLMNAIKTQNSQTKVNFNVKYSGRIFTTTFKSHQPKKASPVQVPKKDEHFAKLLT